MTPAGFDDVVVVRRPLLAVVAFVGLGTAGFAVHGADAPAGRAAPASPADDAALPSADVIVIGRVRVLVPPRGLGGTTVLRVDVDRALRGRTEPGFTMFVGGSRNTADPARPSAPYFEPGADGAYVLFLRPSPAGSGYALVAKFRADDALGLEKTDVLVVELEIAAEPDPAVRARKTLAAALAGLASDRPWTRLHASRELERLAVTSPALFGAEARAVLSLQARRAMDPVVRTRLSRTLRRLDGGDLGGAPDEPGPGAEPAPRVAATDALEAARRRLREAPDDAARLDALAALAQAGRGNAVPDLLAVARGDASAVVRVRAIEELAQRGAHGVVGDLYDLDRVERDPTVRAAIVLAVGVLGDDADVPWLADRAKEGARLEVAEALARIRTETALAALDALGRGARAAVPPDEALARRVEYLRSPAFVEAETAAGRTVGPKGSPAPADADAGRDGRCPPPPKPAAPDPGAPR